MNPIFYAAGAVIALVVLIDLIIFLRSLDSLNASMVRNVSKTKIFMDNLLDVDIDLKINVKNLNNVNFQDSFPDAFILVSGNGSQKLNPGKNHYNISYTLKAVRHGSHSFSRSYLDIESNFGLFNHRLVLESRIEVSIYPPVLSKKSLIAHYISRQFGNNTSKQIGNGIEVAGIRNYIPGDDYRHIDWKTSLRLNSMFTKEFESDNQLSTFVLVDHSRICSQDNLGYSVKIANYLTQQAVNQPTGIITFTHDRITNIALIKSNKNHFEISRHLFSLVPLTSKPCALSMDTFEIKEFERKLRSSNGCGFHSILAPFFNDGSEQLKIIESQGIYKAVQYIIHFSKTPSLIVVITDLAYEVPVLDSVRIATYYGNKVIVMVTSPVISREYDVLEIEERYIEYLKLQRKIEKFSRLKSVKVVEARPSERPDILIDRAVNGWKTPS